MFLLEATAAQDTPQGMFGLAGFGTLAGSDLDVLYRYPLGSRTIRRGDDGTDVEGVALILGYNSDVPGVFDYNLDTLVRNFQRAKGLSVDGIVGTQTWRALFLAAPSPLNLDWAPALVNWGQGLGSGSVPTQTGGNNNQAGGQRLQFSWDAPASLWTAFTWSGALDDLKRRAEAEGFTVQYNSWRSNGIASYAIVIRGISPAGLTTNSGISNRLASLAEAAGFTVDMGSIAISTSATDRPNANNDPNKKKSFLDSLQEFFDKKFGFLGGTISGAALVLLGVGAMFIVSRD